MASGEALFIAPDAERGLVEPSALLPLQARGKVLGVLVIIGPEGGKFIQSQLALFKSIADQLGVAIENARLYEQAAELAVLSERSRLARDLHDAVTQTLFSASLISEVLPKLWERNPEAGLQKIHELHLLTRGALSEMRTLLLELRPDTLMDVDLGDLYRHLSNAFTGRTRIPVVFTQEGHGLLPQGVKEVFYRVAQESLNNIAKHAGASQVQVRLIVEEEQAEMSIRDDGCGFDRKARSPENLGLKIMHERAEAIHANLKVESAPGIGTHVLLLWRTRKE
jgi:signal transduction histidine kinase